MQQETETSAALLGIDEEGILYTKIKVGVEMKMKDAVETYDVYKKWGLDKNKVLQIMETRSFFIADVDALKYLSKHGKDFFIASAIINSIPGISIQFNFFNRLFNRNVVPFKMFSKKEKALKWLRTFKK